MPRDDNFYLLIYLFIYFYYYFFLFIYFFYISTAAKILLREFEANVDATGEESLLI